MLLSACAPSVAPPAVLAPPVVTVPLEPPRLLRRLSLDLRGVLPSVEELDSVAVDAAQVEVLRDAWLDDPRLEERVVHMLQQTWWTRSDVFGMVPDDFFLPSDDASWVAFNRSVGEEPLRLAARIAVDDRPWTDVVTTADTVADDLLLSIYPLESVEEGPGWRLARYTDGRPPVGVLGTNGLWWRYPTDTFNENRRRAAALARLLLCDDYLARPVRFEASASALEDTELALAQDPACLSCHASLDPLAAALFGFWWMEQFNPLETVRYHPERERMGADVVGVEPAWFGAPLDGLAELGVALANDPRFLSCTSRTFAEALWHRPATADDLAVLEGARRSLIDGDLRLEALLAELTDTAEYRAGDSSRDGAVGARLLGPDLLESVFRDLADIDWRVEGGAPLLDGDLRALAGGVDGTTTFAPQRSPSLTSVLVAQRLAESAGELLAAVDLAEGAGLVDLAARPRPGEAAFDEALDALSWRLYAELPPPGWRELTTTLWSSAERVAGEEVAWAAVYVVALQDPRMVSY